MSHSLTKLWVHGVFGTKNRQPLLQDSFREKVIKQIYTNMENHGCKIRIINGTKDHLHILFLIGQDKSISQIMKNIKGSSSHWINQNDFLNVKFSWQVGYGAFSVSESDVKRVEDYIANQKEHHRKMTFAEEYMRFMELHGLAGNR